jgi:hypothetical protein
MLSHLILMEHMIRFGLFVFKIALLFYDHWYACSSESFLNAPFAIYVKVMSLKIKDYRKVIAISEDIRWFPKYR